MFRHPNYYKNLRKLARNRDSNVRPISGSADSDTDQAISSRVDVATSSAQRATGPGPKLQASSAKLTKQQAASVKPRGTSVKLKATSNKLLDPGPPKKFQAP